MDAELHALRDLVKELESAPAEVDTALNGKQAASEAHAAEESAAERLAEAEEQV